MPAWDDIKRRIQKLYANSLYLGNPGTLVTATPAQINLILTGAAAGYKIARGVSAVTGTAVVASGLTSIVAVIPALNTDPTIGGTLATATWSGANITLKCWMPTATGDCTPIASNVAKNVCWIAIGT